MGINFVFIRMDMLKEIIIKVSKTLQSIKKEETGNNSRTKTEHEQKETKNCAIKRIQKQGLHRVITVVSRKGFQHQTGKRYTRRVFSQGVKWVFGGGDWGGASTRHRTFRKTDAFFRTTWLLSFLKCELFSLIKLTHWSGISTSWNPEIISFHLSFSFLICLIWLSQLDSKFAIL